MAYYPLPKNLPPNFDVLIPFHQFASELVAELARLKIKILFQNEKIFLVEAVVIKPTWAQDWWPNSTRLLLEGKAQAVRFLKSHANFGHYAPAEDSKIGKSLLKEIKNLEKKRIELNSLFKFSYFSWTVIDDSLIFCEKPYSRFPSGWHEFNEDKTFPPNRAYLKLWELFTVHTLPLDKAASVIELGASPGGWTWVLSQRFKKVYSVDRADLDKKIQKISNIEHHIGDAFQVDCDQFKDCSWLFSDIICTPQKAYDLIEYWMKNSHVKNYVCTIKFKGDCDFEILEKFLKIENSAVLHLYQNKNEVTWMRLAP